MALHRQTPIVLDTNHFEGDNGTDHPRLLPAALHEHLVARSVDDPFVGLKALVLHVLAMFVDDLKRGKHWKKKRLW